MAIGMLRLDETYISQALPEAHRKWLDEPEHAYVLFQYDPDEIEWNINSKWKMNEEEVDPFKEIPWEYTDEAEPTTMSLKLVFDDLMGYDTSQRQPTDKVPGPLQAHPTQKSLEILEAMATPIRATHLVRLKLQYQQRVTLDRQYVKNERFVQGNAYPPPEEAGYRHDAWYNLYHLRHINSAWYDETVTKQGLFLDDGYWHPPRPLLLSLTERPYDDWGCQLKDLEIDLTSFGRNGSPSGAIVTVTLMETLGLPAPGSGLVRPQETINDSSGIEAWSSKVANGQFLRYEVPNSGELIGNVNFSRQHPLSGQSVVLVEPPKSNQPGIPDSPEVPEGSSE